MLAAVGVHVVLREGADGVRVGVHNDPRDQVGHRLLHAHRDVCRHDRRIAEEPHVPVALPVAPGERDRGAVESVLSPEDAVRTRRRGGRDDVRALYALVAGPGPEVPVDLDRAAAREHHALEVVGRGCVVEEPALPVCLGLEQLLARLRPVDVRGIVRRQVSAPVAEREVGPLLRDERSAPDVHEAERRVAVVVDLPRTRRVVRRDERPAGKQQARGVRQAPFGRRRGVVDVERPHFAEVVFGEGAVGGNGQKQAGGNQLHIGSG